MASPRQEILKNSREEARYLLLPAGRRRWLDGDDRGISGSFNQIPNLHSARGLPTPSDVHDEESEGDD